MLAYVQRELLMHECVQERVPDQTVELEFFF